MSKIGRNEPCPCGSGKKYKKCHLKEEVEANSEKNDSQEKMNFDQLIRQYNSVQILGLLAALQVNPANHGRNFRLEQLTRKTLKPFGLLGRFKTSY